MSVRIWVAFYEGSGGHHGRQQTHTGPVVVEGVLEVGKLSPPFSCLEDASNESLSVEVREITGVDCEKVIKIESHEWRDGSSEVFQHVTAILKNVDGQHVWPCTTDNESVEYHNEEEHRSEPMPS